MPYIIENASGEPITIPDGSLNSDYSIDLIGRNYENYGQVIAKTQIDLLDNFASDGTPPADPTSGQLWYDKNFKVLRSYDGTTGAWLPNRPLVVNSPPTNIHGQNKAGTEYFNIGTGQLYINTGSTGYQLANKPGEISLLYDTNSELSNPTFYGTSIRNIFLVDTDGIPRSVLALYYKNDGEITASGYYDGERIIALYSGHETSFTVADAVSTTDGDTHNFHPQFDIVQSIGGIGTTIYPGMNTRFDDQTVVNSARLSQRSNAAYNLNTGSYYLELVNGQIEDNGGTNIAAANVFHHGANTVPVVSNTYNLGSTTNLFSQGYINDLKIGNSILSNGGTYTIGSQADPVDVVSASTINVYTNILFPSGGDIASTSDRVNNISAANVNIQGHADINGYRMPASTGTNGQLMYLNNVTGGSEFADPISNIKYVTSSNGSIDVVESSSTETPIGSLSLNVRSLDFQSNVNYTRELISIATASNTALEYNNTTGEISFIRTTPFDNLVPATHFLLLQGTTSQTATGVKTFTARADFPAGIDISKNIRYGASADFPAGIPTSTTNLVFNTRDDSTATNHSITFSKKGDITASGDITAFSDLRLKENLEPITDAVSKVKAITGYTYTLIGDSVKHTVVIAQDVESVLPEVVHTGDDPDGTKRVAYGNMVGLLIEAIKDLSNEIDALKQRLGD